MQISIDTSSYNDRRYSRPWIARVDFAADPQGKFLWGQWIGQPGESGILMVDAEPGQIVARGQKDFRKPRNSATDWYQVGSDGSLICLERGKSEAYKLSQTQKGVPHA